MGKRPFDKKGEKKNQDEQLEEDIIKEETEENINNKEESKEANQSDETKQEKSDEEESLHNKLVRLQADFLNYKNRTEKEKFSTYGNAVADVIKDLLPVLDNLERALETDKSDDNSFKDGIQMICTQFMGLLNKKGLKEIEALNKSFDHNVHYGVAFDAESEAEDETIIEVFQKGYMVNDKVIRPSMVKIAKK